MKTKFALKKIVFFLFFLLSSFFAQAQTQDQAVPTITNPTSFDNYDVGQSFTAGLYGNFSSIQIQFRTVQTLVPGLVFSLYNGNSLTNPIYTKSINSIPAGGGIFTITIDTPVLSVPGNVYTWQLVDNAAINFQTLKIVAITPGTYAAGSSWFAGTNYTNTDIWFKTFVNVQTPPPTATATQTFCNSATVANLQATGTALKWYNTATAGTALPATTALTNGTYYVSQTLNSLESVTRTPVVVAINTTPTPVPTAAASQSLPGASTIANLTATGVNIKWYASATSPVELASNVYLVNGTTYHGSQTINACESVSRVAVLATVAAPLAAASLRFDGTNDNVALPVSIGNTLSNGTEMTIEYWFKGTNVQSSVRIQSGSNFIVAGWDANAPKFIISTDGSSTNGVSCGPVATIHDNTWHHLAFVWKKNSVFATYLDGILQNSRVAANVNLPVFSGIATFLGSNGGTVEFMNGSLDEVRIWNRALTGCEISANRNCELPSGQTNLLAYYKFNEGSANFTNTLTALTDSSGNARNGTFNNFDLSGTNSNFTTPGSVTTGATCAAFAGNTTVAPTVANATQSFAFGASVANIVVTGTNIQWYANAVGGTALVPTTTLASGTTYYASQTINSCESASRVAVLAIVAAPIPAASLNFDGTNDFVSLPSFNFSTSDKLTIEAWVKPNNFTNATAHISSQGPTTGTQDPDFLLAFKGSGSRIAFGLRTTDLYTYDELQVNLTTTPTNEFLDGNWHHIAAVYDGSTRKIYIDGVLRGTNGKTGPVTQFFNTAVNNNLGNNSIKTEPFNGSIDEVRFWNRALTDCEINANKNCELPASQTNLYAYYKFNNGNANANNAGTTSLADASGNNRNGTLSNFTLAAGTVSNWAIPGSVAIGTTCSAFTGSSTPAPTAAAAQTVCGGLTVVNLAVAGNGIKWYSTATGGAELATSTVLVSGNTYFASQMISNCESTSRTAVVVTLTTPPVAPVATSLQNLANLSTVSGLSATALTGGTIKWYNVATGGSALAATTTLLNGSTYYATQTIGGCESVSRTAVLVKLIFTGASLKFDGVDDSVTMPTVLFSENAFTIELWVKPTNFTNSTSMLVHRAGHPNHAAGSGDMYTLAFTNFGNNLSFGLKTGLQFCCPTFPNHVTSNQLNVAITPATFLDGNWHHIAAVYDSNAQSRKLYVDGVLAGSDFRVGNVFEGVPQTPITIGNINNNAGFNGSIDELRLWSRPLSACEIINNKDCELPAAQTDLKGYFKCNDGNNNSINAINATLYNEAAAINGTLNNFALTGTVSNWTAPGGVVTGATCIAYVPTLAPVAVATQTFCIDSAPTVASLVANGTAIKWYAAATGGTALASTTALTSTNYFASQTINTCESELRTAVAVTVANPAAPTAASQTFCNSATVASLVATGAGATKWYTTLAGGNALSSTDALATGIYFAAQSIGSCESTSRTAVSVTVNTTPAPVANGLQTFCAAAAIADLAATGTDIKWYSTPTGGTALVSSDALTATNYFASQTINGCDSASRTQVSITFVATTPAPAGLSLQVYTSGGTLGNLEVVGTNIKWYAAATGGSPIANANTIVPGTTYYVSQTIGGCESASRTAISAIQISMASQTVPSPATIADLVTTPITGQQAFWFATATSTPSLPLNTPLVSGTYYVLMAPIGSNLRTVAGMFNTVTTNCVPVSVVVLSPASQVAINFDGTNDFMKVVHNPLLSFTTAMTVEFWVRRNVNTSNDNFILGKSSASSWTNGYNIAFRGSDKINFSPQGWGNSTLASTGTIPLNTWTHVAGTYDGAAIKLYLNGVLDSQVATTGAIPTNALDLFIGSDNGSNYFANCDLDMVRLWNTARTQTQIVSNMSNCITASTTGLVAQYDFENNGGSSTFQDTSGNNLNGTYNNMEAIDWITGSTCGQGYLSLANNDFSATVKVYPNPSNSTFNIEIDANATIQVVDMLGKQIIKKQIQTGGTQIDLSNYAQGVYFMKVTNELNQQKIIKLIKK